MLCIPFKRGVYIVANLFRVSSEDKAVLFGETAPKEVTNQDLMQARIQNILKQKPPLSAQEIVSEATRYTAHGEPFAPDSLKTTAKD